MYKQIKFSYVGNTFTTKSHLDFMKLVNNFNQLIYCRTHVQGPHITQSQSMVLLFIWSLGLDVFQPCQIYKLLAITQQNATNYINILIRYGYLIKVGFGQYQLTEQSHTFINTFFADLKTRQKAPFRFR